MTILNYEFGKSKIIGGVLLALLASLVVLSRTTSDSNNSNIQENLVSPTIKEQIIEVTNTVPTGDVQGIESADITSTPSATLSPSATPTVTLIPTATKFPTNTPKPLPTNTIYIPKPTNTPVYIAPTSPPLTSSKYSCNCAKTCPNLSCEEAYFQLNNCGCSARDGDGDGVPCEAQCR